MDDAPDDLTAEIILNGDDKAVILIAGEIDASTSGILTQATHDATARGATRLVLDLSAVSFMDSSGLAALITTRSVAMTTLRHPSFAVWRLLELTGLTNTFDVES